jgi:hypothetical protein
MDQVQAEQVPPGQRVVSPSPAICGIGVTRLKPDAGLNHAMAWDVASNLST